MFLSYLSGSCLIFWLGSHDAFRTEKKCSNVKEYEIKSNNEINELFKGRDITQGVKERKIRWLRHVSRSSNIVKDALNWKPDGKRSLGRPKKIRIAELKIKISEYSGSITRKKLRIIERKPCETVMDLNDL